MIEVKAIKYYTVARYHEPEGAQNRIEKLKEKNPDHEYTILVNMRAYSKKYIVSRIEHVEVGFPTVKELNLPPLPPKPTVSRFSNPLAWSDYDYENQKRTTAITAAQMPMRHRLSGPFGS